MVGRLVPFALSAPALLAALVFPGCDVTPRTEDTACTAFDGSPGDRGVVVTSSTYGSGSTVVSLLSWDGTKKTTSLWSSARREPGLATALSGDVVTAGSRDPAGDVPIVDRESGVLSWISPTTCGLSVEAQAGASNLRANPYDLVTDEAHGRTFVVRHNMRADGEQGGDLLVLGDDRRTPIGRVDLRAFVADEPTAQPRPARAVLVKGRIYVVVQGFYGPSTGYEHALDATVVAIDPVTLTPLSSVRIAGLKNCGALVADGEKRLVVACTGVLAESDEARLAASGIATIDLSSDTPSVGVIVPARGTIDQSFRPTLALLPSGRVLAGGFGLTTPSTPRETRDRFVTLALDASNPMPADVFEAAPYSLGEVACRGSVCWAADGDEGGRMRRLEEIDGAVRVTGEIVLDRLQAPRSVGVF
jgi:starvation-inducible outer membrane lipoprotein